jgi:peptidylprolyl isomerase
MNQAKNGDTVKVHYTGTLENGRVLDTSRGGPPLGVEIGSGKLIPGFEKAIIGMKIGNTKTITILPEEAYGARYNELVLEVKKSDFPKDIIPDIGKKLQIPQSAGDVIHAMITDINEDTVTLDANHPLAGIRLTFDIELVAIA